MLRPRIIVSLLIKDKGLVKTINFKDAKYLGDPINAVRIFNEMEVDELMVMDIDATINSTEPDFKMIENLAAECRMPICYGGGIKTKEQAQRIISLGVEKVAISSAAINNPALISEIAGEAGSQSVIAVIDVKKKKLSSNYEVWIHNGRKRVDKCPIEFAQQLESLGVGEIVVNSIDRDGTMKGYDLTVIDKIRKSITVPMTVLGGVGSLRDIGNLIDNYGIIGAGASSLFVFKGIYKAVLLNYPNRVEKEALIHEHYRQP